MKKIVATALMLGACVETPEPMRTIAGPCRVDDQLRMRYVGTEFKMRMRDQIQYDANANTARVLRPGDITTKEFIDRRLNIHIGDDGRIDSLDCG